MAHPLDAYCRVCGTATPCDRHPVARDPEPTALRTGSGSRAAEEALQLFSDLYKDRFGVRPRHLYAALRAGGLAGIHVATTVLIDTVPIGDSD